MTADRRDRIAGCLLAGAVGDALGAGIEFDSLSQIRQDHGGPGVTGYVPAYGGTGRITDDTQMTLFTAEGLLRATAAGATTPADTVEHLRQAYLAWLDTQERPAPAVASWLATVPALRHRRAPGNTCLSALHRQARAGAGADARAWNDSKGCGGVMRVAPIGLVDPAPFELATQAAALTHGHPSGHLSAGALAMMIAAVGTGASFADAAKDALPTLDARPGGRETAAALRGAIALAERGTATAEDVERLGGGWVGEEALAIAVYCVLAEPDPRACLLLAVNHSGDSDSTGAITGNLLGAHHGTAAVPHDWLDDLEARDVIERVAADLADVFADGAAPDPVRYASSSEGSNSIATEFMQ